jgi:hypothetical protein
MNAAVYLAVIKSSSVILRIKELLIISMINGLLANKLIAKRKKQEQVLAVCPEEIAIEFIN